MADRTTFTGRARRRRTKWSVRLSDRVATGLITVGGIGTIVAVSGVCLYLLWTVLPLFAPASLQVPQATAASPFAATPALWRVAESNAIGWAFDEQGELVVFRPDTGESLRRDAIAEHTTQATAFASDFGTEAVAIGFDDGTVRLGSVRFETTFFDAGSDDAERFEALPPGQVRSDDAGIVVRTPQDQLRRETVKADFSADAIEISPDWAIRRLDQIETDGGPVLLTWSDDGKARLVVIGRTEDLFTGEVKVEAGVVTELPVPSGMQGTPVLIGLAARAAGATLVWSDGTLLRFDTRDRNAPKLIERVDVAKNDRVVTAAALIVGRLTLLVGDNAGNMSAWFAVRPHEAATNGGDAAPDQDVSTATNPNETTGSKAREVHAEVSASGETRLVRGHDFGDGPAAVSTIAPSTRSREAAVAYRDGTLRIVQVTTNDMLAETHLPLAGAEIRDIELTMPPGEHETVLYAATNGRLLRAPLSLGYPEAGLKAYFRPLQYESYAEKRHVWQTSAATNAAEPKLGLMPLVFGTLKATFYSMLFGVPLALLAALYTSEFLSKSARSRVKPVIEIMASLPSVVLGFLAAIVFAPIVESWLPAVIASALTVPLTLLFAARVWQSLPQSNRPFWGRWRLPLAALALLVGAGVAALLSRPIEAFVFAGDVKLWLNGQIGSGFGAWLMLLVPLSAFGAAAAASRWLNPIILRATGDWSRERFGGVELVRFALTTVFALGLAALLSVLLTTIGLDPRGTYVGTYVQRNALVVGFVMGFAIIPIIYTLADDALNAVPESLRSASLGAGATQWQTAVRVVVPTAMSGLFSAVMVGLGRAVGETMIVLMAAGNTPIMDFNLFNGFETLSAAIATEMPEAVRGSTHFRTLFLAALVLFGLTFLVNTVAEFVRIRFRKRVVQL